MSVANDKFGRSTDNKMRLSAFLLGDSNYHVAGWRHPDAVTDAGTNIARWVEFARILEAAKFDMLFVADMVGVYGMDKPDVLSRSANIERFEPLTLLSALSMVTERLGLVGTCATTFVEPYGLARSLASLDLISEGRAGWNVVTGANPEDAFNFSKSTHVPSAERYARGSEFVDVVTALWGSVDPKAFIRDKQSGVYVDPDGLRSINHQGRFFSVKGPLSVVPSLQGRPILVQAGQSEDGRTLASRVADVIFTAHTSIESAQAFYKDIKFRMTQIGRDPASVKIMPGVAVTVGRTAAEAEAKRAELDGLMDPLVGLARLQLNLPGIDLSQYDLDEPFPDLQSNDMRVDAPLSFTAIARRGNLTLREVAIRAGISKAHWSITGTPKQVVDELEHWFCNDAADGFNLLPASVPTSIQDFVELVLPELRRRGLFRKEYEGRTLRENLGISVPAFQKVKEL